MTVLLTIGDFSRMTHLSVKALRHYHDVGLLEPAEIDRSSGYRFYVADQVPIAQVIRRFRDLGMPVDEVKSVLDAPDVRTRNQVIVAHLERREKSRGLSPGHVRLSLALETPRGFLAVEEIARSSNRIATMSIGVEDYCLELGVEPSADGIELMYPVAHLVTVCKVVGVQPTGLVGSIAGFRDLATFEQAAQRARQLGCEGAGCIHPDQVTVLNRVFTPDSAKVEHARRVVEAFEEGVRRGTASVNLDGRMVDVPVYKRAQVVLARARVIEETERRKAQALARSA